MIHKFRCSPCIPTICLNQPAPRLQTVVTSGVGCAQLLRSSALKGWEVPRITTTGAELEVVSG